MFNKNQICFFFHFVKPIPLYPDVVFINSSVTFFRKPHFGCVIFFNLSGCVHFLAVKCGYCADAPKQKAILQLQTKANNHRIITNPKRRWSEQAFLLFPWKLHRGSHFPLVKTNYLVWRLHLTHCQLCDCLFEAVLVLYRLCFFFVLFTFQSFLQHLKFNVIRVSVKNWGL